MARQDGLEGSDPVKGVLIGNALVFGVGAVTLTPELLTYCAVNPAVCNEMAITAMDVAAGDAAMGGTVLGTFGAGRLLVKEWAAGADVAKVAENPIVDAEKAALDRIAKNSKGPDLTGKQAGTVLQVQSQKRIDDLAVQYSTASIESKDFQLNLTGKILVTDPQVSKGAPVYIGATTSDVMYYFRQLSGVEDMTAARWIPGKGTIYTATSEAGAKITLRDFSMSSQQTGASWTTDVMDKSINGGEVEIKFK